MNTHPLAQPKAGHDAPVEHMMSVDHKKDEMSDTNKQFNKKAVNKERRKKKKFKKFFYAYTHM